MRRTFKVPEPVYEPPKAEQEAAKTRYDDIRVTSMHRAFEILALPPGKTTLEAAKTVYRERIAGYHPDHVAHLGPELRELARCKALEINLAWQFIEEHCK